MGVEDRQIMLLFNYLKWLPFFSGVKRTTANELDRDFAPGCEISMKLIQAFGRCHGHTHTIEIFFSALSKRVLFAPLDHPLRFSVLYRLSSTNH